MKKILIEESTLRRAIKTLERCYDFPSDQGLRIEGTITALRSALDAVEKVEPVGEVVKATGSLKDIHIIRWLNDYSPNEGDKLYAAPTPPANTNVPHTDHPMRHWDRTCPACNPTGGFISTD